MAKGNKTLIWVGVAGIAGLALYEYIKSKNAATTTVSDTSTTITSPSVSSANSASITSSSGVPNGIDPTSYSVVQTWAINGSPQIMAIVNANVPSEYTLLYNLITNYWNLGINPPAAAQAQWVALLNKYA